MNTHTAREILSGVLNGWLPEDKILLVVDAFCAEHDRRNACKICGRQYPSDHRAYGFHDPEKHAGEVDLMAAHLDSLRSEVTP